MLFGFVVGVHTKLRMTTDCTTIPRLGGARQCGEGRCTQQSRIRGGMALDGAALRRYTCHIIEKAKV